MMEVSASTFSANCNSASHTNSVTYNDVSNSFINSTQNSKLAELLKIKRDDKTDALEAVKLDPAVLEAQITVITKQKDIPEAIDPSIHDEVSSKEALQRVSKAALAGSYQIWPGWAGGVTRVGKDDSSQSRGSFKELVSMQEAALLSLTPHQLEFLMKYTEALRKRRFAVHKYLECAFCKNNGESASWYTAHTLKDGRGRVRCPVLRGFRCPRCGATGDRAHTIKYCPQNHELDY